MKEFNHDDLVTRAQSVAFAAHGDQKYGDQPYSAHLNAVANRVNMTLLGDDEGKAAAYLHDTVEDTSVTIEAIADIFGGNIAKIVLALTKEKGESTQSYLHRIRHCGKKAVAIKVADRIANVTACIAARKDKKYDSLLKRYAFEHVDFVCALYDWREGELEHLWIDLCVLMNEVKGYGYFHPNDVVLAVARSTSTLYRG